MEKSYRIRTNVGTDQVVHAHLKQDIDFLEILSLKIRQENTYQLHVSNYGVIVGRVLANEGFGIPNAKVSVFIPLDEEDENRSEISNLYPYKTLQDKDDNNIRYNLLPSSSKDECYKVVGTFPNKRKVLDNETVIEVFEKYWKYTTVTNQSGDYMIFGVPKGNHQVHVDIDLSDIGVLSQKPRDFVYKGYNIEQFDNASQFKDSTNLDALTQLFSQNSSVYVYPFWGETDVEEIAITRCDIQIQYKFEPTCVFFGSIVSDNYSNSINHKCNPSKEAGLNRNLVTGEGTIEMIRKTADGSIEEFPIQGNRLIDGNGVWCYQIPMNLDYVCTDEFGNIIPTDNPNKGIATRTSVRFRISMQETSSEGISRHRAKYLVPNNLELYSGSTKPQIENADNYELCYEFGSSTRDEDFRDLFWNKVYSVKNYIPRIQRNDFVITKKYSAIKSVNYSDNLNPFPFNHGRFKITLTYRLLCMITTLIINIVARINGIVGAVACFNTNTICIRIYIKHIIDRKICAPSFTPFAFLCKKLGLKCIKIDRGIVSDNNDKDYFPNCEAANDTKCDICMPTTEKTETDVDVIKDMVEQQLAQEYQIINLDFYNDWVNGVLYYPLWFWKKTKKRSFLFGLIKFKGKSKFCDCDVENRKLRIYDTCVYSTNDRYEANVTNNNKYHKEKSSIKIIYGIIKEYTNRLGQNIYYYTPGLVKTKKGKQDFYRLYSTDIILLGSLNDCDIDGLPKPYINLPSTTANLPYINALMDGEDDEDYKNGTLEISGMDWMNNGEKDKPKYSKGLFLDLTCNIIRTIHKTCVNLHRLSELGVSLDSTFSNNIIQSGKLRDGVEIKADGLITRYEIMDNETRSMFASLNHNGLTKMIVDESTTYNRYDLKYKYLNDFDGHMKSYALSYTQNQTNDLKDNEYVSFRYGDIIRNYNGYIPLYNNSFYFYFGLNEGNTSIDKFNRLFYSKCYYKDKRPFVIYYKTNPKPTCGDYITPNPKGSSIDFEFYGIKMPYRLEFYNNNTNDLMFKLRNQTDKKITLSSYTVNNVVKQLENGEYKVIVYDAFDNQMTKTISLIMPDHSIFYEKYDLGDDYNEITKNDDEIIKGELYGKLSFDSLIYDEQLFFNNDEDEDENKHIRQISAKTITTDINTALNYNVIIGSTTANVKDGKVKIGNNTYTVQNNKVTISGKTYNVIDDKVTVFYEGTMKKFIGSIDSIKDEIVEKNAAYDTVITLKDMVDKGYKFLREIEFSFHKTDELDTNLIYSGKTTCYLFLEDSFANGIINDDNETNKLVNFDGLENNIIPLIKFVRPCTLHLFSIAKCNNNLIHDNIYKDTIVINDGKPFEIYRNDVLDHMFKQSGITYDNFDVIDNVLKPSFNHEIKPLDNNSDIYQIVQTSDDDLARPDVLFKHYSSHMELEGNDLNSLTKNDRNQIIIYRLNSLFKFYNSFVVLDNEDLKVEFYHLGGVEPVLYRTFYPNYKKIDSFTKITSYYYDDEKNIIIPQNAAHEVGYLSSIIDHGTGLNKKYGFGKLNGNRFRIVENGQVKTLPWINPKFLPNYPTKIFYAMRTNSGKTDAHRVYPDVANVSPFVSLKKGDGLTLSSHTINFAKFGTIDKRFDYDLDVNCHFDKIKYISGYCCGGLHMVYDDDKNIIGDDLTYKIQDGKIVYNTNNVKTFGKFYDVYIAGDDDPEGNPITFTTYNADKTVITYNGKRYAVYDDKVKIGNKTYQMDSSKQITISGTTYPTSITSHTVTPLEWMCKEEEYKCTFNKDIYGYDFTKQFVAIGTAAYNKVSTPNAELVNLLKYNYNDQYEVLELSSITETYDNGSKRRLTGAGFKKLLCKFFRKKYPSGTTSNGSKYGFYSEDLLAWNINEKEKWATVGGKGYGNFTVSNLYEFAKLLDSDLIERAEYRVDPPFCISPKHEQYFTSNSEAYKRYIKLLPIGCQYKTEIKGTDKYSGLSPTNRTDTTSENDIIINNYYNQKDVYRSYDTNGITYQRYIKKYKYDAITFSVKPCSYDVDVKNVEVTTNGNTTNQIKGFVQPAEEVKFSFKITQRYNIQEAYTSSGHFGFKSDESDRVLYSGIYYMTQIGGIWLRKTYAHTEGGDVQVGKWKTKGNQKKFNSYNFNDFTNDVKDGYYYYYDPVSGKLTNHRVRHCWVSEYNFCMTLDDDLYNDTHNIYDSVPKIDIYYYKDNVGGTGLGEATSHNILKIEDPRERSLHINTVTNDTSKLLFNDSTYDRVCFEEIYKYTDADDNVQTASDIIDNPLSYEEICDVKYIMESGDFSHHVMNYKNYTGGTPYASKNYNTPVIYCITNVTSYMNKEQDNGLTRRIVKRNNSGDIYYPTEIYYEFELENVRKASIGSDYFYDLKMTFLGDMVYRITPYTKKDLREENLLDSDKYETSGNTITFKNIRNGYKANGNGFDYDNYVDPSTGAKMYKGTSETSFAYLKLDTNKGDFYYSVKRDRPSVTYDVIDGKININPRIYPKEKNSNVVKINGESYTITDNKITYDDGKSYDVIDGRVTIYDTYEVNNGYVTINNFRYKVDNNKVTLLYTFGHHCHLDYLILNIIFCTINTRTLDDIIEINNGNFGDGSDSGDIPVVDVPEVIPGSPELEPPLPTLASNLRWSEANHRWECCLNLKTHYYDVDNKTWIETGALCMMQYPNMDKNIIDSDMADKEVL